MQLLIRSKSTLKSLKHVQYRWSARVHSIQMKPLVSNLLKQILTFYSNSNCVSFFSFINFIKRRKLPFIKFSFCLFYFDSISRIPTRFSAFPPGFPKFLPLFPAFVPWFLPSHPYFPHSRLDSPNSHRIPPFPALPPRSPVFLTLLPAFTSFNSPIPHSSFYR